MSIYNFDWILPDQLAAMAMPDGEPEDWHELERRGIGAVVNLTRREHPHPPDRHGLDYLRVEIRDYAPPEPQDVDQFVDFVERQLEAQKAVAVHCMAGRGRTGTMVACWLVRTGMGAEDAIKFVRRMRPGSIETASQEAAVRDYARRAHEQGAG